MSQPKVILITGANSGIGFAASEVIASADADYHVIIGSRNLDNGKAAVEELRATGNIRGSLSTVQVDVSDPASIKNAAKQVEEEFGRLDVLVNNAGIAIMDENADLEGSILKTFRTNALGPVLMGEAFRPLMLKSKNAYSINVSSGLGSLGLAQDPSVFGYELEGNAYRMSKAALNMWTVEQDRIWKEKGIKTFVMCPGFVISNLRGKNEAARNGGGMAGDPKDSGKLILDIFEGKRDKDAGKFVHKDGVYPW